MEMIIFSSILIIGSIVYWIIRNKKNDVEASFKTKISYHPIHKEDKEIKKDKESQLFDLDIISLTNNQEKFETVVSFKNNKVNSVRIKVKEIEFFHQGKIYNGDASIYELNMGTNDAILKNTIISNGLLLKNILFTGIDPKKISKDDKILIVLEESNITYKLSQSINGSTVQEIKIIEMEEI